MIPKIARRAGIVLLAISLIPFFLVAGPGMLFLEYCKELKPLWNNS